MDPGFPRWGAPIPEFVAKNLLFDKKLAENCMKMNEIGPGGGGARVPRKKSLHLR